MTNQSRPRWKRYLWRAIAVSLIAGTSSLLTRLSIWTHELQRPLPSLIAGIDGAPDQVDRAFQQRLEATYPTGVSEQRLIADLLHEGFQANWNWTGSRRSAVFARSTFICWFDWEIAWAIDDQHRISQITGHRNSMCG